MQEKIEQIRNNAEEEITSVSSIAELENVRIKYLGKKGELTLVLRGMGSLPAEERPVVGSLVNEARDFIESKLSQKEREIKEKLLEERLKTEKIDITMPSKKVELEIFIGLGYEIAEGPEIELATYNFDKLNTPPDHPARDIQDTFYITDSIVLRSQTSPMQARVMEQQKPPIKIICPGTVYRSDSVDATHSPVFHQIEGLVIDKHISMSDLKGTLELFAKKCLGEKTKIRYVKAKDG